MNSSSKEIPPLITLIGDPEETFYQLGLKDREDFLSLFNHITQIISTPWKSVDRVVQELIKQIITRGLNCDSFLRFASAYAEGVERELEDVVYALLVPEMTAALSKWLPAIPTTIFGCSSYFAWNTKSQSPMHARILDFPLATSYDRYERALLHRFPGKPDIFSFGCVGMPYPALTAMTSAGVTLACHQKYTDVMNSKGTPIFHLLFKLLQQVSDRKSALEFLDGQNSITSWGIYLTFKDGDTLAYDLWGEERFAVKERVGPKKIFYYNNLPLNKNIKQSIFRPFGFESYCQMRHQSANKKITELKRKEPLNDLKLIKSIATPVTLAKEGPEQWRVDPVHHNSIAVATLNAKEGKALYIPGDAPKIYQGTVVEYSHLWEQNFKQRLHHKKSQEHILSSTVRDGMRQMILAQVYYDQKNYHLAYHHIQLSCDYLASTIHRNIPRIYFLIFQFIHESHTKGQYILLQSFKELRGELPPYLNDQCQLFVARLELMLYGRCTICVDDFITPALRNIFIYEQEIPQPLIHVVVKNATFPRLEILDVIYGHLK
ncbi:MAG: hypothetical protein HN482_14380 [Bdellovibrionales bacterium]|nr:hypothetical protein [Bdellovibrionales bacterium]